MVVGMFFGKDGKRLDRFGANLAAAALPGYGSRVLHGKIQRVVVDIIRGYTPYCETGQNASLSAQSC